MHVIIVGAGQVGRSTAADLSENHDVVIIEQDGDIVEELTYSLDVLPIEGDGTDVEVLEEAGVAEADMLIACTDVDEVNIVAAGAAKTMGEIFTIARVKRRQLLETWRRSTGAFGVDFMVCTDLLAAEAVVRISELVGAHDVDTFASGLIRMGEFEIGPESVVTGQTVSEADRYDSLTFAAIFRDDDLVIPQGTTTIEAGDRLVVIGSLDSVSTFATDIAATTVDETDRVVIVGGSEVGYQAARIFSEHGIEPRLIERDPNRARELAEALPNAVVYESDATDVDFLAREHVDQADVVVAHLDSDEKTLLVSLIAKQLGVRRTVAVVESGEYADLFETVGIDVAVNPREETAEEIIRFTRNDRTEKVAMLEHDRAEVLEVEIDPESVLAGRPIQESVVDLPDGVVVGAISRDGEFVIPRGQTRIESGDHVVLFVDVNVIDDVVDRI